MKYLPRTIPFIALAARRMTYSVTPTVAGCVSAMCLSRVRASVKCYRGFDGPVSLGWVPVPSTAWAGSDVSPLVLGAAYVLGLSLTKCTRNDSGRPTRAASRAKRCNINLPGLPLLLLLLLVFLPETETF